VFEFGLEYIDSIFRYNKNTAFLLSTDTEASYQQVFAQAATSLKGKVLFSTSGKKNKSSMETLGHFISVQPSDLPLLCIVEPHPVGGHHTRHYTYGGELATVTVADVEKFVDDFLDGRLEYFVKS